MIGKDVVAGIAWKILILKKSMRDPETEIGIEKEIEIEKDEGADLKKKIRKGEEGDVKGEKEEKEKKGREFERKKLKKFESKRNPSMVRFFLSFSVLIFKKNLAKQMIDWLIGKKFFFILDYPDYNEDYIAENIAIKYEDAEKIVKKQERDRDLGNGHMYNNYGNHDNHNNPEEEEEGEDYS